MFLAPTIEKPKENQGFWPLGPHGRPRGPMGPNVSPWGPQGDPMGSHGPPNGPPSGPMGPGPIGPQGLYRQTPDKPPSGCVYVIGVLFWRSICPQGL